MKRSLLFRVGVVVVLLAVGVVGCRVLGLGHVDGVRQLIDQIEIGRTDKDGLLTASGTIQADEVRIASELGGRIVGIQVRKGDQVRARDVLVRLDDTQLVDRLAEAEAAVAGAQADLAVIESRARVEEVAAAQAALSLAQAQRDGAYSAWQNALLALRNPQEIDAQIIEAQTQVNLAEQGAILAQAQLEREKLLRNQTPKDSTQREVADLQVLAAEKALARAQADLQTARTLLDWLRLVRSRPLGLIVQAHAAEGQYQVAESGVAVAQAGLDDLLAGATPQEVAVARQTVRLAQAQAGVLEANRSRLTLTSPVDGIVLNQTLRAGELAAPAATILTVADLSRVRLSVYVPANRIGQISLGQGVRVTVDSLPGQAFAGRVQRIGDQPEFTPRNIATKEERVNTFYVVEIALDNEQGLLKPGMPGDAVFGE